MKKIFFMAILLSGVSALSSNGRRDQKVKSVLKAFDETACCTRSATAGTAGTANYVSVTVTKCVSGRTHDIARSAACGNASTAATNAANTLSNADYTITPTRP